MMTNRKLLGGMLTLVTASMVGCATSPTVTPSTTTKPVAAAQVNPADTEASLTPQELGQTGQYSVKVLPFSYGYRHFWFPGRRCRWYWVPSGWGYDFDSWDDYWDNGRWVLVCGRRYIPWWWYGGEWAGTGAFGYRPFGHPRFPREYFMRFRHREMGGGMGPGYGGGMGPGYGGGEHERETGPGGPGMGGGPGNNQGMGPGNNQGMGPGSNEGVGPGAGPGMRRGPNFGGPTVGGPSTAPTMGGPNT